MAGRVIDKKLYHMTTTKPYKQAFTASQVVRGSRKTTKLNLSET